MDGANLPTASRCVIFGTPSYSRTVSMGFWASSLQTKDMLCTRGIAHGYIPIGGDPYLSKVRNHIASIFLDDYTVATDLFFIDDDVSWEPEAVLRLLDHPADIVAGMYPHKRDDLSFPVEMASSLETGDLIERDGAFQAISVPTGFLRIKRRVLESMAATASRYDEPDYNGKRRKMYNIFEMGVAHDTGEWWGEDFAFCMKAKQHGFDCWVIPDLVFGHQGMKTWSASFAPSLAAWRDAHRVKEAAE